MALAEGQGPREIRALRPALIAEVRAAGGVPAPRGQAQARPVACPSRTTTTGWPSTGCAWTRRARRCWRRCWARWPRRSPPPSTGRTSGPATSAGPTRWSRSAAAPPPPAGPRRPRPKAAVVVTMGYQDLVERTGAGTTLTGELLAPETVRRMACDAGDHPGRPRARRARSSTSAGRRGWRPRNRCRRCGSGTGAARSRAARGPRPGATPITVWHWCDGGPTDLSQPGPALPAAPHDRAPEGLHRHRHRVRGDLAPVAAPPRDPPYEAGRTGTPGPTRSIELRPAGGGR